jgi:hypothetical protein
LERAEKPGNADPQHCQGWGREFESLRPLQVETDKIRGLSFSAGPDFLP